MREFNEKYFPPLVQVKRENDFIRLRQGALSLAKYETQFTKLSKFAPELVATEERRLRRFVQRLNVEIQETLAAVQIDTFIEALEKAQRIEIVRAQVKAFHVRKKSTPTSTHEKPKENVTPSKVRRTDFPHYPLWTFRQLEEGSIRGVQIGKGQQEREFLKKAKKWLLTWLVDTVKRQIILRMNVG